MENKEIEKHIAELYWQYEHLKKEIKRDREELYELTVQQNKELKKQNELLRKEIRSYLDMKDIKAFITTFVQKIKSLPKTYTGGS